jgi:hypothetical protein
MYSALLNEMATKISHSVVAPDALMMSFSFCTAQGKQQLYLFQRHGLAGEPAIDSTKPSPKSALDGGVETRVSAIVRRLAHHARSRLT